MQRREDRDEDERADEDEPDLRAGVPPDAPPRVTPEPARLVEDEFGTLELGDAHSGLLTSTGSAG